MVTVARGQWFGIRRFQRTTSHEQLTTSSEAPGLARIIEKLSAGELAGAGYLQIGDILLDFGPSLTEFAEIQTELNNMAGGRFLLVLSNPVAHRTNKSLLSGSNFQRIYKTNVLLVDILQYIQAILSHHQRWVNALKKGTEKPTDYVRLPRLSF